MEQVKILEKETYRCAVKEESVHLNFWKEIVEFIDSWKFVHPDENSSQNSGEKRKNPGSLNRKGWLQTVNGMIKLSEEMLKDREYFMTKRCNQDCLEKFF